MPTTLEIDVHSRWDAVHLLRGLACYHAHLVQLEYPGGRWLVRVRTPGLRGEGIVGILGVVEDWQRERGIADVGVCVCGAARLSDDDLAGLSLAEDLRRTARGVLLQTGTSL
ncbi:MAG: hypothetical protein ABSB24_07085 [Gaiellaceae bacterium]|jgi:hypothetical protein